MMDTLPRDVFFVIIKKIAEFLAKDLVRFETSFPFYQGFNRDKAILRELPHNCVWYLANHSLSEGKRKLMRQISHSEHVMFSVASAAQMIPRDNPNLGEIKLILKEAVPHKSGSARYFNLILKVLAKEGFSMDEVLLVFMDLFERKQLAECGRALANIGGIPFF